MLAWEWMVEKAREGEEDKAEKKKTRKISQSAQVGPGLPGLLPRGSGGPWGGGGAPQSPGGPWGCPHSMVTLRPSQATYDPSHGYSPQPVDLSGVTLSRELQVNVPPCRTPQPMSPPTPAVTHPP